MIRRFDYAQTPEHACEMAACADLAKTEKALSKEALDACLALDQFYGRYFCTALGEEFARAMQVINDGPPIRILDVGAGRGETSLYLADHGHQVFPVEPSYEFCQVIEYVSQKFGKELTIYNSSIEHLDLAGEQFDVVIFNVSLHHCDDPAMALKNVYRLLGSTGKLFLISEPMLPFFKTHSSVMEDMHSAPEEFGHYGGNEHSYHCAEYVSMMKQAGFRNLNLEVVARYRTKHALAEAMKADLRPPGLRKNIKNFYMNFVYLLVHCRLKLLLAVMQQLSLIQLTFSASK